MAQEEGADPVELREEEKPIDVVVYEQIGSKLAPYLEEAGQNVDPLAVQEKVRREVFRKWGTNAEIFQDQHGTGWLVDISEAFSNIGLHAVVRSIHGTRMAMAVVDEDELDEFRKTGEWKTPDAKGLDPEVVEAMQEIEGNPPAAPGRPGKPVASQPVQPAAQQAAPREPDPDEPRLIVYWDPPEAEKRVEGEVPQVEHSTYGQAQQRVLQLLMQGAVVEVWEGRKKPKINIEL